ncbi:hypothetical protein AOLI_G00119580 [Acnodon oligacanthus]
MVSHQQLNCSSGEQRMTIAPFYHSSDHSTFDFLSRSDSLVTFLQRLSAPRESPSRLLHNVMSSLFSPAVTLCSSRRACARLCQRLALVPPLRPLGLRSPSEDSLSTAVPQPQRSRTGTEGEEESYEEEDWVTTCRYGPSD